MAHGTGDIPPPHLPYGTVPAGNGAADATALGAEGRVKSSVPTAGVLEEFSGALSSARGTLSSLLDLMALEARRAGLTLMWMVIGGVVAAICIVGAWGGLSVALAMWAVSLGVSPLVAVLAVALLNLAFGTYIIYVCIGMSRDLLFSATRRQVAGSSRFMPPSP